MTGRRRAGILILVAALSLSAQLLVSCQPSAPSEPTGVADKIQVSQISGIALQVLSPDKIDSELTSGDQVDFKNGVAFTTAQTGTGYVQLGLPGNVLVYLASNTEILLEDASDAQSSLDIILKRGLIVINMPDVFPAELHLAVRTPDGARVWLSGATIGLAYDTANQQLYADCLQDYCGYVDENGSESLPRGSHVSLKGTHVVSAGPGHNNEMWKFVPDISAEPTPHASGTPDVAATQSCRYFTSLGLPCGQGFPTPSTTPTATPDYQATQACRRSQNLGTPCP